MCIRIMISNFSIHLTYHRKIYTNVYMTCYCLSITSMQEPQLSTPHIMKFMHKFTHNQFFYLIKASNPTNHTITYTSMTHANLINKCSHLFNGNLMEVVKHFITSSLPTCNKSPFTHVLKHSANFKSIFLFYLF